MRLQQAQHRLAGGLHTTTCPAFSCSRSSLSSPRLASTHQSACSTQRIQRTGVRLHTASAVAGPAARGTAPQPQPQAAQADQAYSWTRQWYPVAVLADTRKDEPHAVRVLGGRFVLWADSKGQWHCHQDRCPHRLAPLSEGKIVQDNLQCSYHGWKFNGRGSCVHLPQAPAASAAAMQASPRSCVTSFPVREEHGLLWVWPDSGADRFEASAGAPTAHEQPPVQGADGLAWYTFLPWFRREFPYSFQTLFDNTLDPSHVPWSHHGIIGNREAAQPLDLRVEQAVSPTGLKVSYQTNGLEATASTAASETDEGTIHMQFRAPHTLVYDTFRKDGTRSKLLAYCTPSTPGTATVFAQTWDTRLTWLNRVATPPWLAHLIFLKAGDGDVVLLAEQEALLPEMPNGWQAFHMPTKADVAVRMWRQWLEKFTRGPTMGPYQLASEAEQAQAVADARRATKQQRLDRFKQHVQHCPSCSGAMVGFQRASWAAAAAAAFCLQMGVLAARSVTGAATTLSLGPLSLPLHAVWAVCWGLAAAGCARLAVALDGARQAYVFEDYKHNAI